MKQKTPLRSPFEARNRNRNRNRNKEQEQRTGTGKKIEQKTNIVKKSREKREKKIAKKIIFFACFF